MKRIGFGLGQFLIFLVPTFLRPEIGSPPYFLETRMYLPIIGILIIISETGWGQSMLSNKRNASVYAVIVLLFSAVHLVHTRNFKDRVASWEFAVASSPSLPMAPQNLGAIYIMQGNLDRTESVIKDILALRPRSSLAYNNLGVIYLNRGQLDLAKEALKKSLEIDPRYDDAAYLLGLLYHQTEQTEKAKATQEGALRINPCHPQTLNKLVLLGHISQDKEALRRYVLKLRRLNYPLPRQIRPTRVEKNGGSV